MGWKAVRDHYGIMRRETYVEGGEIRIGEEVTIAADGTVRIKRDWPPPAEIMKAVHAMQEDRRTLLRLMAEPDVFGPSVEIWTYDGDVVHAEMCESPAWPGLTHSGRRIYENTHSTNRDDVVRWAIQAANAAVESAHDGVVDAETRLAAARRRLDGQLDRLDSLMRWRGRPPVEDAA